MAGHSQQSGDECPIIDISDDEDPMPRRESLRWKRTGKIETWLRKPGTLKYSPMMWPYIMQPLSDAVPSHRSLDDVIGMESVVRQICEVLVKIKYSHQFSKIRETLLLHGPSGCGKSYLLKSLAGHLGFRFMSVSSGFLFTDRFTENNLCDLPQSCLPFLIVVDDVQCVTRKSIYPPDTTSKLIEKLKAFRRRIDMSNLEIILALTTSRLDLIDPCLKQFGRFNNEIGIGILNREDRLQFLKHFTRVLSLGDSFPWERLVTLTQGFVAGDLEALTCGALSSAIKRVYNSEQGPPEQVDLTETSDLEELPSVSSKNTNVSDPLIKGADFKRDLTITEIEARENDTYYTEEPTEPLPEFNLGQMKNIMYTKWFQKLNPATFKVTYDDFLEALKDVTPSMMKEGFITNLDVSWKDVGSLKVLRDELRLAVVAPLKYPDRLEKLGLTPSTGILLYGPPGCGKTLLAKAIANEAGVNFISVDGSHLLPIYGDERDHGVKLFFQRAKDSAPCIMFFDDFDALCPKRTDTPESSSSPGVRVVHQLLTEIDSIKTRKDLFVLAATNKPDIIDPALLQPGRLEKVLFVGLPNVDDRKDILLTLTNKGKKYPLDSSVDIYRLAKKAEGFTGADLSVLLREAALITLRKSIFGTDQSDNLSIKWDHFERALKTVHPSIAAEDLKQYEHFKDRYLKRNASTR